MGAHLEIDLALIRATGVELGRIRDVVQQAEAAQPGAGVLGEDTDTGLAKELTKHSSPGAASQARVAS